MLDQWMGGQAMLCHIGVDTLLRPVGERIDLQSSVFDLKTWQCRARCRLERLAAGKLCIKTGKGMFQRQDFADFAAAIRIIGPAQAVTVFLRKQIGIRGQCAQIGQPQPGARGVSKGLGEGAGKVMRACPSRVRPYHEGDALLFP